MIEVGIPFIVADHVLRKGGWNFPPIVLVSGQEPWFASIDGIIVITDQKEVFGLFKSRLSPTAPHVFREIPQDNISYYGG